MQGHSRKCTRMLVKSSGSPGPQVAVFAGNARSRSGDRAPKGIDDGFIKQRCWGSPPQTVHISGFAMLQGFVRRRKGDQAPEFCVGEELGCYVKLKVLLSAAVPLGFRPLLLCFSFLFSLFLLFSSVLFFFFSFSSIPFYSFLFYSSPPPLPSPLLFFFRSGYI